MSAKHLILSIDLGSTTFKAALFSCKLELLSEASFSLNYIKDDGKVELPVSIVDEGITYLIEESVRKTNVKREDIAAIGIASQAQTFTLLDNRDHSYSEKNRIAGQAVPIIPFISWLDSRATESYKELLSNQLFDDIAQHSTLSKVYPNMQLALFHHLQRDKKMEFSTLLSLPSYVAYKLSGRPVTDKNLAAMSGLYSLQTGDWYEPYLTSVGLVEEQLGELVEMGSCIGKVTADNIFDISESTDIFLCGNDQTAGAYGAKLDVDDVLINLGTAHIVYGVLRELPASHDNLFRGEYPDGRFYGMYVDNGGAILSHLLEQCPEFESFEHIHSLAQTVNETNTLFTINDTLTEFSWSRSDATDGERAYAVFEYLSSRISEMVNDISHDVDDVYLTGGGRQHRLLIDMIREKLGKKIVELETSPLQGIGLLIQQHLEKSNNE